MVLRLLLLFLAAAGWAAAERPLEVAVQPASYGITFFQQAADAWARMPAGRPVQFQGDPRVHDQVRIRVMAGDWPDATDAQLDYEALIAAGRVLDLTPWLEGPNWAGTGRWRDDFHPGVLARWTRDGKVYGLPYAMAAWVLFYDAGLFARQGWTPPRTWDEFFVLAERIRATGRAPLALPGVYLRYADAFLRADLHRLGGSSAYAAYQQLAPGIFVSPEWIQAAGTLQRVGRTSLLEGWAGMTHTSAQQAFLDGRSAMVLSASWFLSEMATHLRPEHELGVANLPGYAAGPGDPAAVQLQAAYTFFFATGNPERERAVVDLYRYLTSPTVVRAFVEERQAQVAVRGVPREAYHTPALRQVAALVEAAPVVFDAAPPPTALFQAFFLGSLNNYRHALVTGTISPTEFGQRLEEGAAAERARIQNPDAVQTRHPWRAVFLVVGALVLAGLGWSWRAPAQAAPPAQHAPRGILVGFVGPGLLLFSLFILLPALGSFLWSVLHWNGFNEASWAGLTHFRWLLLESDAFGLALANNFFLMVVPTLFIVPIALGLAVAMRRGGPWAGAFRAAILFPNLLGGIAASLIWLNAFDPHTGLVNAVLVEVGRWTGSAWLLSFAGHAWLSADRLYGALVPVYLWMGVGFNAVLYLGAMQAIEPDLYEAAELDGASPTRQFFQVTLPLMADTLAVSVVFIVVAAINTFETVWLMTAQDPSSRTHVLSTLMVSTLFREFQVGRATALAVVMFIGVFLLSWAIRRAAERGAR